MEKNLKQTGLDQANVVQEHALIDCIPDYPNYATVKSVKFIGCEDVYNMEVRDHHNFSVNGGLIVHNSIDMTRYAMEDDMRGDFKVGAKPSGF